MPTKTAKMKRLIVLLAQILNSFKSLKLNYFKNEFERAICLIIKMTKKKNLCIVLGFKD